MEHFFKKFGLDRIQKLKSLNEFCIAVEQNSSENIFSLTDDFKKLSSGIFMQELIEYELYKLFNDILYSPSPSTFSFVNLFDCHYCTLSLYYNQQTDFVEKPRSSAYAADRLMMSLSTDALVYTHYKQYTPYPLDILDKSRKLQLYQENAFFAPGDIFQLKAHEDILVFHEGNKALISLVLTSKVETSFLWEYETASLTPKQIITGGPMTSRLEHTCRLLGELGHYESIPVLKKYLDYEDYNVRWEAAKNIMLIDFDSGIAALEYLKQDPHPQIQLSVHNALLKVSNLINS
jgi:hypothetical protein